MERRDLPVAFALGALSATVALAFGRVFDSGRYLAPLIGATLLAHAIGLIARWRRLSAALAVLASGVGLLAYITLVAPGGLPGHLVDQATAGWRIVQHDAVPLHTTDGTVLLGVGIVWLVAALADHLAFRRGATLGTLAPGVMVLIWVAALGVHHGQTLAVGAFGATAVIFLAVQHQALLEQRRTRLGPARAVEAPRLLVAGSIIGVAAVVIGIATAGAVPGGDRPLFQTPGIGTQGTGQTYRTSVPPLLDIGDKLNQGAQEELFTVRASSADYWRITALDEYRSVAGGQWTLTAEGNNAVGEGLDGTLRKGALIQHYRISNLGERWMPAAYRPVRVSRADTLVVRASSTLVTSAQSVTGLRYTVASDLPELSITPAQRAGAAGAVPASLDRYTALPSDFPIEVRDAATSATAGLTNPYDKAKALRDFFRNGSFTYDPSVQLGDDESALVKFLRDRHGFCVQFASAYATMARVVGIPARVAVGFTPGSRDSSGVYHVTNFEAHAWPEVWLAGLGWVHAFDPTPPSALPGGSSLPGEQPATPSSATQQPGNQTPITSPPATGTPPASPGGAPSAGVTVDRSAGSANGGGAPWLLVLALLVIVLGVAPAAAVVGLKSRRRVRRRASSDPAAAISGAWAEAIDALADRRVTWPPSDTPRELAHRVPRVAGKETAAPLRALADSYTAAQYGSSRPPQAEADAAWDHVTRLRKALSASGGVIGRVRARLDPATLRRQREPAGWSRRSRSTND